MVNVFKLEGCDTSPRSIEDKLAPNGRKRALTAADAMACSATRANGLCIIGPQRNSASLRQVFGQYSFHPDRNDKLCIAGRSASLNRSGHGQPATIPVTGIIGGHQLNLQFARTIESPVRMPQGAAYGRIDEARSTGPRKGLGKLPSTVEPHHEERQATLPNPLKRGQPMGELLEADAEAPFKKRKVISGRLASAQEPTVGHQQSCGEVPVEMAREQRSRDFLFKLGTLGNRVDQIGKFKIGDLQSELKITRRNTQHFRKLDLPCVEIEAAEAVGHYIAGEDPDSKLMALAQTLGKSHADIPSRQAQFIRQLLCRRIEV